MKKTKYNQGDIVRVRERIRYSHGPQYNSYLYVITKVLTDDSIDCYKMVMVPKGEETAYPINDLDDNQFVSLYVARGQ